MICHCIVGTLLTTHKPTEDTFISVFIQSYLWIDSIYWYLLTIKYLPVFSLLINAVCTVTNSTKLNDVQWC